MVVRKILHMNAGDGDTSYANNSGLQKLIMFKTLPVLEDTLKRAFHDLQDHNFPKCLKMADLGCSSGPNTLFAISHIMDIVEELYAKKGFHAGLPEIEVFLNDLPHNDFNTLFKLFPSFYEENGNRRTKCFLYGLPGSFYNRLFPSKSLDFAYSCYCLHWLSQVPQGLANKNEENIYIAMTSPREVFEVYARQFQKDFSTFLSLRAEEMISRGHMVLTFMGRSVEDPSCKDDCGFFTLFASTLGDMVAEGLVKAEDLYSFNLPFYLPCEREVEKIIENEGSFTLDKFYVFQVRWDATFNENQHEADDEDQKNIFFDKDRSGKLVSDCIRALLEPMLAYHFGFDGSIVDHVFKRYAEKVGDHLSSQKSSYFSMVVSLCRR